jgi:predicted transposase YbfD/YdcC
VDMAEFAEAKEPYLRGFLQLKNGLPSHDTFSRLFRHLDPAQFRATFQGFMRKSAEQCQGVVAIDGKVLRRSFDRASGKSALHMVSAWGCEQRLVLAQIATDAKSNEITAVPKLLDMLSLKGTIVTVDALNCQRTIAQQIVDQGDDYALALKRNQGTLHDDVVRFLGDPASKVSMAKPDIDADHGRIETRTATVSSDIKWLFEAHGWPGLKAIGKVERRRETLGKTTTETAYYLLSTDLSPMRPNGVARSHWGVENGLHWRLDVTINEDQDRKFVPLSHRFAQFLLRTGSSLLAQAVPRGRSSSPGDWRGPPHFAFPPGQWATRGRALSLVKSLTRPSHSLHPT